MITGEKMMIDGTESFSSMQCNENITVEYEDWEKTNGECASKYGYMCDYEFYLTATNSNNALEQYISKTNNFKKKSLEYPLILNDNEYIYFITDELKKQYLKHTDKEREITILKLKEQALKLLSQSHQDVDKELNKLTNIEEIIDMAYLENELFNFKNKGITR